MFVLGLLQRGLLTHAEVFKDISEHLVGLYFAAGDFAEMIEAAAEVLADKVGGKVGGETVENPVYVGERGVKSVEMAQVAYYDAVR